MRILIRIFRRDKRPYFYFICVVIVLVWIYICNSKPKWSDPLAVVHLLDVVLDKEHVDLRRAVRANSSTSLLHPRRHCDNVMLAVIIMSAVGNTASRQAIRDTWGSPARNRDDVYQVFLLGRSNTSQEQVSLEEELRQFDDIIQEDFIDSYDNLTLKSVMMLKWLNNSCKNVKYVLKTDDDMFINFEKLFKLMIIHKHAKRLLMGMLFQGVKPLRHYASKWYAPLSYVENVYPDYLSGTAYLISGDIVSPLYNSSLHSTYFRLEDIFITGISAKNANFTLTHNSDFNIEYECPQPCLFKEIISAHRITIKEMYWLWEGMHSKEFPCDNLFYRLKYWFQRWLKTCSRS